MLKLWFSRPGFAVIEYGLNGEAKKDWPKPESRSRFRVRFRKTCRSPRHSCNGVPGLRNQVKRRTKIRWGGMGFRLRRAGFGKTRKSRSPKAEARKLKPEAGFEGSVVGIQN
jgi:hypothetical protein